MQQIRPRIKTKTMHNDLELPKTTQFVSLIFLLGGCDRLCVILGDSGSLWQTRLKYTSFVLSKKLKELFDPQVS